MAAKQTKTAVNSFAQFVRRTGGDGDGDGDGDGARPGFEENDGMVRGFFASAMQGGSGALVETLRHWVRYMLVDQRLRADTAKGNKSRLRVFLVSAFPDHAALLGAAFESPTLTQAAADARKEQAEDHPEVAVERGRSSTDPARTRSLARRWTPSRTSCCGGSPTRSSSRSPRSWQA